MNFQFDVAPVQSPPPPAAAAGDGMGIVTDLLRQILDVSKEHLNHARAMAAAHETRWRSMVNHWREEFPELPTACKEVLPTLEKAYGSIIAALAEELRDKGSEALDNEFALQDFIDRYGMRLGQMGHVLNLVAPLAETAGQGESAEQNPKS